MQITEQYKEVREKVKDDERELNRIIRLLKIQMERGAAKKRLRR